MIAGWLGRQIIRLIQRVGFTTLLSLVLLGVALGSIANGLVYMIHDLDTSPFLLMITGGVLIGWLLAKSPLPGWLAGALAAAFGAGVLFIRVGRLESACLSFVRSYLVLSVETWRVTKVTPHDLTRIDTAPFSQALQPLTDGFGALFLRARLWLEAFAAGAGAFDPIAAALVWGFGLWILTVWASWCVRRFNRVFMGILPAGGLYAFVLYYTGIGASIQALIVMLGAILLLVALRNYVTYESSWRSANLDQVHSPLELGITVVSLTAVLMLAAALTPSLSVRQMAKMVDALVVKRVGESHGVAESFGLQASPEPETAFDQAKKASLPNQKLIGSGPRLSKQPVMLISVAGYDPLPWAAVAALHPNIPPRYYWRSFTYDQYNGRGWYSSPVTVVDYSPGVFDRSPEDKSHQWVQQKVQPLVDMGEFVYATGELQTLDAAYQVAWRAEGDALAVQSAAMAYTAISTIPVVSEAELRSAGTNYPDWVRQRYLRLPVEVPARVQSLGYALTAVQPTPYDQAIAIEAYLRTIPYTLDVPAPPVGWDVADYFLFDLKRGYCDYFATAMVVLARSVNIPARLVTGYASDSYDIINARFVVLEENAHAWVEVYFPSYGWVEFEPTSGLPPIDHGRRDAGLPPVYRQLSTPNAVTQAEGSTHRRIDGVFWGFVVLLVVSAFGLARWGVERWRMWRMSPETLVAHVYRSLYRQGRWFALRAEAVQTPREFSERFRLRIAELLFLSRSMKDTVRSRREQLMAFIERDLHHLTILYERSLFSPIPLDQHEKANALEIWEGLNGHLRRVWWSAGGWVCLRN